MIDSEGLVDFMADEKKDELPLVWSSRGNHLYQGECLKERDYVRAGGDDGD